MPVTASKLRVKDRIMVGGEWWRVTMVRRLPFQTIVSVRGEDGWATDLAFEPGELVVTTRPSLRPASAPIL